MKQPMNKEQKIQELTARIEHSQAEIDELKEELRKLQKKPYEISYPKPKSKAYYINNYTGEIHCILLNVIDEKVKYLYETGIYFDTKEEAEQFKREQTLIKKIKCWAKEQQGDWKLDWSDKNQCKYSIDVERFNKETICDWCWGHDKLSKLPYFKTEEIAQACIDEFGDEILEVFC
ncbi:hypothetical protein [Gemella morbillorum]|uniref:hypothetical protein n=1 Tax=Gemella morbillorum TaxID=29391 RepID=UPI0028D91148|nr:hypothetical protein [Gemella morbillorum]